jgi:hypothetical protein
LERAAGCQSAPADRFYLTDPSFLILPTKSPTRELVGSLNFLPIPWKFGPSQTAIKMYKLPSQPISITYAFIIFAMLMLNLEVAFGRDDPSKTYRCTAKDSVSVQDNGTLTKGIGEVHRKYFDGIVIDILTGDVTYPSTGIRENRVVQKTGADANDYVLIPSSALRRKKTAANAVTDFIRLDASKPQATFMAFSLSDLVTGTCEIVR